MTILFKVACNELTRYYILYILYLKSEYVREVKETRKFKVNDMNLPKSRPLWKLSGKLLELVDM